MPPSNARLRLGIGARRRTTAAGRHRGAPTTLLPRPTGVVADDAFTAQDLADFVGIERLVLEQGLGDHVQLVEPLRENGTRTALGLFDEPPDFLVDDLGG